MMMSMMDREDVDLIEERASLIILVPPGGNSISKSNNRHDEEEEDVDCENPEHNFYEDASTLGDDGIIGGGGSNDEGSVTTFDDDDNDDDNESSTALHERILVNTSGTDSSEQKNDQKLASLLSNESQILPAPVSTCSTIKSSDSSGTLSKLKHTPQRATHTRARSLSEAAATTTRDPNNKERQRHPGLHNRHHRASYQNDGQTALIFRNKACDDDEDDIQMAERSLLLKKLKKQREGSSSIKACDDDEDDIQMAERSLLLKTLKKQREGSSSIKTASTCASTSTATCSPNASRRTSRIDLMDVSEPGTNLELPFWESLKDRGGWLVGLLVLQSTSSFVISRNERLLQDHIVIVQFLTMLVGAGGNAGNQASVRGM
jgi:hypothetical protein